MDKKSFSWMERASENTKKGYRTSIRHYEKFHNASIDELISEALDEQTKQVPEHLLQVYDRINDFQNHLALKYTYSSVQTHMRRIKTVYKRSRVTLPYFPPLDAKQCRRNPAITYAEILTKEEIKSTLPYLSPSLQARVMIMATGGYSLGETATLTLTQFLSDLWEYHKSDDVVTALKRISRKNNIVWVTQLIRVKTQKPYYGICNPETVQKIAQVWLLKDIEKEKRKYNFKRGLPLDSEVDLPLFPESKNYVTHAFEKVNDILDLGTAGGRRRFTPHSVRRFNATRLSGASLNDDESLKVNMIDEIQGRSMNSVQDRYIKTNPIKQKLLYVKVMNNVSLFNKYEYEVEDGEIIIKKINDRKRNEKLELENKKLHKKLQKDDSELKKYVESVGIDTFKEQLSKLLGEL